MPTSSQVLILQKKIPGISLPGISSPCLFKQPVKCTVAGVYQLGGCMSLTGKSVADVDAVNILGRESAQLFKYHNLPQGFSSILSLDKLSGLFQWQALGGDDIPQISGSEGGIQRRCISGSAAEYPGYKIGQRPRSANSGKSSKVRLNPFVFDSLIKLGFNRYTLLKKADIVFDGFSSRKVVSSKRCSKTTQTETLTGSNFPQQKPGEEHRTGVHEVVNKADSTDDLSDIGSDNDELCEENRVKPSMHMRRDVPELRPRAAIFSFRDNEFTTHAEVKYLIETQIGVRVKSIQFDPLDVRTGKPKVHSRWIVDFFSDWDLHEALKNGLKVGKDKLLFFKHDDIAKREVSSFKYYMAVQNAKKALKSKSLTSRTIPKRPAKSVKSLN